MYKKTFFFFIPMILDTKYMYFAFIWYHMIKNVINYVLYHATSLLCYTKTMLYGLFTVYTYKENIVQGEFSQYLKYT